MAMPLPLPPPTTTTKTYPHTLALVNYLLATYSASSSSHPRSSGGLSSSPPQVPHPVALALRVQKLALSEGTTGTISSSSSAQDDNHKTVEKSLGAIKIKEKNVGTPSHSLDSAIDEDKVTKVIQVLEDASVDEEDKPDALKVLLKSILVSPDHEPLNLDPLILSLLHRYLEDLHPSGNPVPPLPNHGSTTPSRPSVSRSSSFRRHFSSTPIGMSTVRSATASSSTGLSSSAASIASSSSLSSAPNSPFRSASPSLRLTDSSGSSSTHGGGGGGGTGSTPAHSPWSSPRATPLNLVLNAAAAEFKFSVGASDFVPGAGGGGGASVLSAGTRSPAGSAPGTPLRSRSPMPVNPQAAQNAWAAHNSPLGTPKVGAGGSGSAASSPSYFPRHLEAGIHSHLQRSSSQKGSQPKIPRLPWADANDSSSGSQGGTEDEDEDDDLREETEAGHRQAEIHHNGVSGLGGSDKGYTGGPLWGNGSLLAVEVPYNAWSVPSDQMEIGNYQGESRMHPGAWDPFEEGPSEGYSEGYTPTFHDGTGIAPYDPEQERANIEFANSITGTTGLGAMGAYSMTPFDVLHSVFSGSKISAAVLEEALVMSGWDVDQAIEYIIETRPGGADTGLQSVSSRPHTPNVQGFAQGGSHASTPVLSQHRMASGSGSRPMIVSRDSFENGSFRSQTPTSGDHQSGGGNAAGGRVCRYYLSGNCLRSDCKFSHDVGKAVCKFWLRGHCLKGDGRCDFLHSIPPIMRADFEQRARDRSQTTASYEEEPGRDEGPDLDFPSLGEIPRSRHQHGQSGRNVALDPSPSRFSGAVKFGRTATPTPVLPRTPLATQMSVRDSMPQARFSARLSLRPPSLLPTLPTGPALAALYARYRSSFLELGANRNKCLAKAADCWKRGDGAGARKFSREAQDWNRQVAIEGRDSANQIIEERKKVLKEALLSNVARPGAADDVNDRRVRGHEKGYGVVLGVVSQTMLPRAERHLSAEERTEVALDLHGLHADEAVSFLGDFLLSLERERFPGLAFVVIGQAKHTGSSDLDRGAAAGRLRLEQACTEFLSGQGWPWTAKGGIICVDALR